MWVCFIGYLGYMFVMCKKGQMQAEEIEATSAPIWKLLLQGIIGLGLVVWGSDITVDAATKLAEMFGMSERFIGLTVVALGTSLPELFTSVTAARKGNADIAIGNIVGSNIFNILFVVGLSSMIINVPFAPNFRIDMSVAAAASLFMWAASLKQKKLVRWHGFVMLAGYVAYFLYLL